MGRIFEKRKDRMFARWAKNAKAFTKIGKEIAVAVKFGGGDPNSNPRLRMAIQTARGLNMPKDRVEAAIKRATSKDAEDLHEVVYEGYAPHGVAIIIETATNNNTRTIANVRSIMTKHSGTVGTSGSLDYLFQRRGVFTVTKPAGDLEELELELIDYGLEEMFEGEDNQLVIYCTFEAFGRMPEALEKHKVEVKSAGLQRIPLNNVALTPAQEKEVEELIAALEEDDDVQHVYTNMKSAE